MFRILYLEDNPADSDLTLRALARSGSGIQADVVSTVAEALQAIDIDLENANKEKPPYALALLDMHLPDGSGLEVLSRIRDKKIPMAVVVLTGSGDEDSVMAVLRAGADEYLAKRSEYWNQLSELLLAARNQFLANRDHKGRRIKVAWAGGDENTLHQQVNLSQKSPQFRILPLKDCDEVKRAFRRDTEELFADVLLLEDAHSGVLALECLQELKQEGLISIPVLLIAGVGDEALVLKALKAGAWDFLVKDVGFSARLPWALESAYYRSLAERERWALRASESRLRTIFAAEPEGILVLHSAGGIMDVNPAGLALMEINEIDWHTSENEESGNEFQSVDVTNSFGRTSKPERNFSELLLPVYRNEFTELLRNAAARKSGGMEAEMRGLRGAHRWLDLRTAFLPDAMGDGGGVLCMARDITHSKENEEKLRHSEKMNAFGQLAGGIAHDFNNQLAAILGYAEILSARLDRPELRRYAESIELSAKRSADLTKSLLTFARRTPTEHHPVSLHALILETLTLLDRTVDKRISISRDLRASVDQFMGDPSLMQNALLNLCLNARDAMPQGGRLALSTELLNWDGTGPSGPQWPDGGLSRLPHGTYLHMVVTDTGLGMDDTTKRRLFEPFFTTIAV
jgi:signal transduction histidine kinase/DNA-binding response OmpR family regulator